MSTTLADVQAMIDEAELDVDDFIDTVLPRWAYADNEDSLTRSIVGVSSDRGFGSEPSVVYLEAAPWGSGVEAMLTIGEFLAHVAEAQLAATAVVLVAVQGEPDDRVDGANPVVEVGATKSSIDGTSIGTLILRLDVRNPG